MKVSVVISLCDNRHDMFARSLDTWSNQTEKDFELVLVDDAHRNDILELCKKYQSLNFQFIRIDNSLCDVPITTFTPVLSNNIGLRMARGNVVCITGPETLQSERNVEVAATFKNRKQCGYGLIYKSNKSFVNNIVESWKKSFDGLLNVPGAKAVCLTKPPHPPAYYYFAVVAKQYVCDINGLDERFGQGFCAEDDDFANRMKMNSVMPVFEHSIVGIHQDHSMENSKKHNIRYDKKGKMLRYNNLTIMRENIMNQKRVVNLNHLWGDPKVITKHEVF
jgi:glycosyltransferase involved in cell wall biosynthesis